MSNADRKARKRAGVPFQHAEKVPTQPRRPVKENPMLTEQMIRAAYAGASLYWQRSLAAAPTFPNAALAAPTKKESA